MKEKLEKQLADIEEHIFIIDMVDHWTREDEEAWDYWQVEKKKVEKELERIENE